MKLAKTELVYLKWSLAFVVLALILAGAIGSGSFYFNQSAQQKNRIASNERTESQAKLARAAQEEQELREKTERFLVLQNKGYVGTENRLDWIEQLARISRERKLYDFQYEFDPQRIVDPILIPAGAAAGTHRFLLSSQRFRTRLLHEGDLLAFLADLRRNVKAYLVIRECQIERIPQDPTERGVAAQLAADCRLDWITLQESK
jgi:hypothetical protein